MAKDAVSAAELVPASRSLSALRRAAKGCRGCLLWKDATQTVFGAGPRKAELMLVGEQPGDREDVEGEPFVGPAGAILARALAAAEIDREDVYLTNASSTSSGERAASAVFTRPRVRARSRRVSRGSRRS